MRINNLLRKNSRLVHLTLMTVLALGITNVSYGGASKDCYTCNPDYVPGNPVQGNQTLGQLAQASMDLVSKLDGDFMSALYGFCLQFPGGAKGGKTLRKKVIAQMEQMPVNGSIDIYFLEAGCQPGDIGRTLSPIAHLAAEIPADRTEHLEVIKKYFAEKKKDGLFTKMINAKNTEGHTTLDYVQYLKDNHRYISAQKESVEQFITYLCSNGGKYSVYNKKSCSDTQVATK